MSKTYFKNSAIVYLKTLLLTFFVFFAVIFIFDILELMRIASSKNYDMSFILILKLAGMRNYSSINKSIPIIILTSSFIYFYKQNEEIISAKSIGISNYGILMPVICIVLLFGILNVIAINPIGMTLLRKFNNYEKNNFKQKDLDFVSSFDIFSGPGIWLKSKLESGTIIINAAKISQRSKTLENVVLFSVHKNGFFMKEINAKYLIFSDKQSILKDGILVNDDFSVKTFNELSLPINISITQILESLSSFETVSFFQLFDFINVSLQSGLHSSQYLLELLKHIFFPFFLISFVMLSYAYATRKKFLICILIGLSIFFLTNFIYSLGSTEKISFYISALSPVIISNAISSYLVMRKEII